MIDPDSVPSTVESAARQLAHPLAVIANERTRPGDDSGHVGTGLAIRNAWSLWDADSPLKRDAVENYGIAHADDISGLIRAWAAAITSDNEFDPESHCQRYRDHWARLGTDPLAAGGWKPGE